MEQSDRPQILVIDDEPGIRELCSDVLGQTQCDVSTAGSGAEAIHVVRRQPPDLLVTDLMLGDCTGLDVIDTLQAEDMDIPSVVITGQGDPETLCEASRRRPLEMLPKPLNTERLIDAVQKGLTRRDRESQYVRRIHRLRKIARRINNHRKSIDAKLRNTCTDLASAYRTLSEQFNAQQIVLDFQRELIAARIDDDVFRSLFRMFVHRSGPVFGISIVCDANAQLRIVGRFGVPHPDSLQFCQALSAPMIDMLLSNPEPMLIDAGDRSEMFDDTIVRYLPGLSVLAVPLIPSAGEMIGIVVFYRKGEQPFRDCDVALADMIAYPTAVAIKRND